MEEVTPFLAKHGQKNGMVQLYESQAIDEVRIDGEIVAFRCRFQGCAWESDSPEAVIGHSSQKHGKISTQARFVKEVPVEEWERRTKEVTRRTFTRMKDPLARAVWEAMKAGGQGNKTPSVWCTELAKRLRQSGVHMTDEGAPEVAVIAQIRELVGGGESVSLRAELDEALAKIKDMQETRALFLDLMQKDL